MTPSRGFLPLLLTVLFMSVTSGTLVNVALPWIGEDLHADEATYAWVVSGYLLAFGVFNAIHGRLGDVVGVRRLYMFGVLIFGLGSLASALAPDIGVLIAIRVLQGAGAAAMPSLGATMITRLLPPEERGTAMGLVMSAVGVAASISPFIGGALLQVASWRVAIGFTAITLLVLPLAPRVLPASLDDVSDAEPFDVLGATLMGLGISGVILGLDLLRGRGPTPLPLGLLAAGAALLAVFLARNRRVDHPFAPPEVLANVRYRALVICGGVGNAARFGTLVLVPIVLADLYDAEPLVIGGALFPGAVLLTVLSPWAGRLAARRGTLATAGPGTVGLVLSCLLSAALVDHGAVGLAVAMSAFGVAFALVQPAMLAALGDVLPHEHVGLGNGLYLMLFFVCGSIGVALSVSVLSMQAADAAPWIGHAAAGAGRYVNALLALGAASSLALPALAWLPRGRRAAA